MTKEQADKLAKRLRAQGVSVKIVRHAKQNEWAVTLPAKIREKHPPRTWR